MFKIFYADKDATLYQGLPDTNTGIDEILEIGKRYGCLVLRSLVLFCGCPVLSSLSCLALSCFVL